MIGKKKKIYYIILKSLPNCEGRVGAEEKARLSGVLKTEEQRWVGGLFCTLNGCTQHRMPIKPEASTGSGGTKCAADQNS